MQVKLTDLSDTKFKLEVKAGQDYLTSLKQKTLRHLGAKHVKLPGFRTGKAPLNLVEKQVDQSLLQQEFLDEAINHLYVQAIKAEKIRPIANPQINIKKFVPFTKLEFEAEVEAIGQIKLPDYKNVKLEKPKVSVTARDVDEVINGLKKRQAERKEVDRPAKNGDELVIDFKGTDTKGEPVNGADGKDFPIIIGSNTFIPGFEPNLVGLKAGANKTFSLNFPKDYGVKALQNKKVTFAVKTHKVSEVTEPKVDDAFATKAGPFKALAELKADIKKQLLAERHTQTDRDFENALVGQIASKAKVVVPETLIDEQVQRGEEQERQNLAYRGQTWQDHLKEEGVSEEEHRKRNRPDAELSVKAGLVLSEIADQEKITVTPEELEIRLQVLKGQYKDQTMQAELDKPESRRDIENRLMTEKTLAKLVEYAR